MIKKKEVLIMNRFFVMFFLVIGCVFIYQGYQFIKSKESSFWISKPLLRKKVVSYSGNVALWYGVLFCILGLIGITFALIAAIGVISPNWTWLIIGLCVMHGCMFIGFFILSILARKSEPNTR
jgi:drug/metabolite transporter (DMT)-like permease